MIISPLLLISKKRSGEEKEIVAQQDILPRHLSASLHKALASARIVNIVGPRQAGKTTLVRDLYKSGKFITLDDESVLAAIENDPVGQLEILTAGLHDEPLIIDEVQRSEKLVPAIKKTVDSNRRKGQFILTGSSNIFTSTKVSDSLAGRMRFLRLWPLTVSEIKKRDPSTVLSWALSPSPSLAALPTPEKTDRKTYIDIILRGGFPEIFPLPVRERQEYYRDYIDAVVDRDVASILPVRKTDALRRLINQLAVRTAMEMNLSETCELVGIRRNTIEQYLDVLSRLSLVSRLGAWTPGESRREIKNAKSHFVDTGIACALRGLTYESFCADANPTALGGLVESFVYSELLRLAPYQEHNFRFYHWRISRGQEIDIVAESASRMIAIEVKASSTVYREDLKHLRWFMEKMSRTSRKVTGLLFYLGQEKLSFGGGIFALPVSILWSRQSE